MTIELDATVRSMRNVLSKFGQGAFFAYNAGGQDILTGAGLTGLTPSTEVVDVCSWYTNGVFTPKQPGYYLLFGKVHADDADFTNGTTYIILYIRKNGATPAHRSYMYTHKQSLFDMVILEANGTTDYFDLAVTHNSGATIQTNDISFGGVFVSYNNP